MQTPVGEIEHAFLLQGQHLLLYRYRLLLNQAECSRDIRIEQMRKERWAHLDGFDSILDYRGSMKELFE